MRVIRLIECDCGKLIRSDHMSSHKRNKFHNPNFESSKIDCSCGYKVSKITYKDHLLTKRHDPNNVGPSEEEKERVAEYQRLYGIKNKERISEMRKRKTICECGARVRMKTLKSHRESYKHEDWLNSLNNNPDLRNNLDPDLDKEEVDHDPDPQDASHNLDPPSIPDQDSCEIACAHL